ncbi:MAG: GIY-YIG nuclease family protein [Nitrososphaerota archaeon]|nr:GIY-YIG nuclease family protein [Nitrososphaerota archaeon]
MGSYHVYILRCADGSLYTGCTKDMGRRVAEHLAGKASKYTRSRLPVTICYTESAQDRSRALRREAEIKRMSRGEKLLICGGTSKPKQSSR